MKYFGLLLGLLPLVQGFGSVPGELLKTDDEMPDLEMTMDEGGNAAIAENRVAAVMAPPPQGGGGTIRCQDNSWWRDQDGDRCTAYQNHPSGARYACDAWQYKTAAWSNCPATCDTSCHCSNNQPCQWDEECQYGTCMPKSTSSCQQDWECGYSRVCKWGQCQDFQAPGCRSNSDCSNWWQVCRNGQCADDKPPCGGTDCWSCFSDSRAECHWDPNVNKCKIVEECDYFYCEPQPVPVVAYAGAVLAPRAPPPQTACFRTEQMCGRDKNNCLDKNFDAGLGCSNHGQCSRGQYCLSCLNCKGQGCDYCGKSLYNLEGEWTWYANNGGSGSKVILTSMADQGMPDRYDRYVPGQGNSYYDVNRSTITTKGGERGRIENADYITFNQGYLTRVSGGNSNTGNGGVSGVCAPSWMCQQNGDSISGYCP